MGILNFPALARLRLLPFVSLLEVGDGIAFMDCDGDGS